MRRVNYETAPGAEIASVCHKRAPIEPFMSDLPGLPGALMCEAPCISLISVPDQGQDVPAIAVGMPSQDGQALAFFYAIDPKAMRTLAFQLLQLANHADGGTGRQ